MNCLAIFIPAAPNRRLVIGLVMLVLCTGLASPATANTIDNRFVPINILINMIKCEVAKFQTMNDEYSRSSKARYVINGATVRLILRLVKVSDETNNTNFGIPVFEILAGDLGTETKNLTKVFEEQTLVFEMDTRVGNSDICEKQKDLSWPDGEQSIFEALKQAKDAIDVAAAGEPKMRVLTHSIKKHMTILRDSNYSGRLFLVFVSMSKAGSESKSASQEMEIILQLNTKRVETLTLSEAFNSEKEKTSSTTLSELISKTVLSGHPPGSAWFLCNQEDQNNNCSGSEWKAIPLCQLNPLLEFCDSKTGGSFFEQGPTVYGRPDLLDQELENMGWSSSPASQSTVNWFQEKGRGNN